MTADGRPRRPLKVESLDHEGKGVAHEDGKVVFIEGALPGETAHIRVTRSRTAFDVAVADRIEHPSSQRVTPQCPHFGVCGGCSLQHLDARAQVAAKQRVLEDNLARIGLVRPEIMLAAIHGPTWGYRYRARLSVRDVHKRGGVLVGFRERKSTYVVDMSECHVLPRRWSDRLIPLRRLVEGLSIRDRMPQIEIACGESVDAMVLRILAPLTKDDETLLRAFADHWKVCIYLQPKGPETICRFHPMDAPELDYTLPEFDLRFPFGPSEFTQVNYAVNRVLVSRAMRLLDPQPGERVADMFCGLGNFSLPIARRGASVVGYEGSDALVRRARETAAVNGLSDSTTFEARDLFTITPEQFAALGPFDKMLIDPPRDGAIELVKSLGAALPKRIVYVSCAPGTLSRDAGVLVNVHGYRLRAAGVVNMFPHTAHVESIAVFDR